MLATLISASLLSLILGEIFKSIAIEQDEEVSGINVKTGSARHFLFHRIFSVIGVLGIAAIAFYVITAILF